MPDLHNQVDSDGRSMRSITHFLRLAWFPTLVKLKSDQSCSSLGLLLKVRFGFLINWKVSGNGNRDRQVREYSLVIYDTSH